MILYSSYGTVLNPYSSGHLLQMNMLYFTDEIRFHIIDP